MTVKIPAKKTKVNNNDTSDICGLNDFVDLDSNSYCSTENNKLKSLQDGILGKQWLNSDHMNHVNKLMIEAGYSLSGFWDTMLAPVLQKNGTWHIPAKDFRCQNSPSTNIYYNN